MRCRGFRWALLSVELLFLAAPAAAQSSRAPAIWYRASEKCPSGPQFLGKLSDGRAQVRLAGAGDHIDFVVTLLSSGAQTVGRLERQTNGGTVAIRELSDATCDRVADALALSLALALDPSQRAGALEPAAIDQAASTEAAADQAPPALPEEPAPRVEAAAPPTSSPVVAPPAPRPQPMPRASEADSRTRWFAGLGAGVQSGLSTSLVPLGQAFVDVDHVLPRQLRDLALRLALVGALGSLETSAGSVQRWVVAGRGEVCPFHFGSARVGLRPCLAFELGATGVSRAQGGGLSDQTLWAAPGAELRGSFALLPRLRLELGGGVVWPLARNEVFAGAEPLYRDAIIAVRGLAGISVGLP